jgi:hypothetical protein
MDKSGNASTLLNILGNQLHENTVHQNAGIFSLKLNSYIAKKLELSESSSFQLVSNNKAVLECGDDSFELSMVPDDENIIEGYIFSKDDHMKTSLQFLGNVRNRYISTYCAHVKSKFHDQVKYTTKRSTVTLEPNLTQSGEEQSTSFKTVKLISSELRKRKREIAHQNIQLSNKDVYVCPSRSNTDAFLTNKDNVENNPQLPWIVFRDINFDVSYLGIRQFFSGLGAVQKILVCFSISRSSEIMDNFIDIYVQLQSLDAVHLSLQRNHEILENKSAVTMEIPHPREIFWAQMFGINVTEESSSHSSKLKYIYDNVLSAIWSDEQTFFSFLENFTEHMKDINNNKAVLRFLNSSTMTSTNLYSDFLLPSLNPQSQQEGDPTLGSLDMLFTVHHFDNYPTSNNSYNCPALNHRHDSNKISTLTTDVFFLRHALLRANEFLINSLDHFIWSFHNITDFGASLNGSEVLPLSDLIIYLKNLVTGLKLLFDNIYRKWRRLHFLT